MAESSNINDSSVRYGSGAGLVLFALDLFLQNDSKNVPDLN